MVSERKQWRFGERREEIRPDGSRAVGTSCGEYAYDANGRLVGHLNMTGMKPLYERRGKSCYGCFYWNQDEAQLEDEKPCYWCAMGFSEDGTLMSWTSRNNPPNFEDNSIKPLLERNILSAPFDDE